MATQRTLACALAALAIVLLAQTGVMAGAQQSPPPSQDLAALIIDAAAFFPDAKMVSDLEITPYDYQPIDTPSSEVSRAFFVGGHRWDFESLKYRITIGMIEFRMHSTAASFSRITGDGKSYILPNSYMATKLDFQYGYVGSVGRVVVIVGVSPRSDSVGAADIATGELFLAQMEAIPILDDMSSDGIRWIGNWFGYYWGAFTGVVIIVGLLIGVGVSLVTDHSLQEWIRNGRIQARTVKHHHDVTHQVRPILRRGSILTLVRVVLLALVSALALAWPGLRVLHGFYVIFVFLFLWQAIEMLLRSRESTSESTRGKIALTLILVGGVASSAILVFGILLLSFPVANKLLHLSSAPEGAQTFLTVMGLVGLTIIRGSRLPLSFTKRLLQPTVKRRIKEDTRAPLLLLRSFQDDTLNVRPPFAFAGAIDTFSGESKVRFEEVIAWTAWERGPLRAIGQPGTLLQPLGAVREYVDDDTWRDAVNEISEEAQAVVVIAGRSPGLVWEIEFLRSKGMLAKTVLVFAPVERIEDKRRMNVACTTLELNPSVLDVGSSRHVLALGFDDQGNPQVHTAAGRMADAYVMALNRALDGVSPNAWVSRPADWSYLESQGPASDLARSSRSRSRILRSASSLVSDTLGSFIRI